jgi:hypothetical protein
LRLTAANTVAEDVGSYASQALLLIFAYFFAGADKEN